MDILRIKGLVVAPFSGFKPDGGLDISKIELQQRLYKDNGVTGVFVSGTTGEGSALTIDEKKALYKEWAKYRDSDFKMIGFLGGTSIKECIELAKYASEVGLDAVAMTAPYYQKASCVHDLALTLAEVALSVPQMPFFYYHIPCLTNVYFAMYDLLKEMDVLIPNLAGIKYTYENMMDFQMCLNYKERKYNIMWGRDEMFLEALSIGTEAFVGSTYGYNAPIYNAIKAAYESRDMECAAELQYQANIIISLLEKYGNGAGKAFMKATGLDLGPTRRPFHTLDEKEYMSFCNDLENTLFDRYKCIFK